MNKQFGKKKLIKDISANTLQTAITQVFSLVIFYITSKYLSKDDFGEFNWSMALGSTVIALASLGLDVVFVKRVALGENVVVISGIHFFHTVIVGIVLTALVAGINALFPAFQQAHYLFLMVFVYLSLINISNSFRLCLMGLETYRHLAILALIANLFKFGLILALYTMQYFTIKNVIYVFIASSTLELLLGYFFVSRKLSSRVKPLLKVIEYKYFILESLPQLGVIFFDSALARVDWIMLGIIGTAEATAEYAFAYRIYESSKLPLLVIAPILLTRFSKMFNLKEEIDEKSKADIQLFFRMELFVVMFIPMVLICVWSPLMDYFTNNKYGAVNELNYILLAGCVPLHCVINFLWSMGFAQGQLKAIMFITISVALLNLACNSVLIPLYGSLGASIAFLVSTIAQTLLYIKYMKQTQIRLNIKVCAIYFANTILSIMVAKFLTENVIVSSLIAVSLSVAFALLTRQISLGQIKKLLARS